jgi:phosphoenolpyruvate carboxylase
MMKKLNSPGLHIASESKKLLNDTMMVTIAGISAAMKNTG